MTDEERTRALVAAAGLPAQEDEIAELAAGHPGLRAAIDGLYAVDPAREGPSALRFRADPSE